MKPTVIIGAGPMGLYLAYLLHKAKVKDIVIYDPRAGEYLRPGHVNRAQFTKLEDELNKEVPRKVSGHIKDYERALFKELSKLKIPIEKKEFVRFGETPGKKSIFIKTEVTMEVDGVNDLIEIEEEIECDFVFDCTGSRRILVNAINDLVKPAPFTLKAIKEDVAIKQHMLAYIQMSERDLDRIPASYESNDASYFKPEEHVSAVNRMRALGWKDFGLPQLYGAYFGTDKTKSYGKVCLYMECPDNLAPSAYEAWVKTAIDVSTKSTDISFSQLPPPKKYASKPRLTSYIVNPRELQQAAYESKKYPTLIPIGDSQTEPHPGLAQGIQDGMERIDALMKHIVILNGAIAYFDTDEYHRAIQSLMKEHKERIINRYNNRNNYSHEMLVAAKANYTTALEKAKGLPEEDALTEILQEIQARLTYHDALELRASILVDGKEELSQTKYSLDTLSDKLTELSQLWAQAYENLPAGFTAEKEKALAMLNQNALFLKECGNRCIQASMQEKALKAYGEALALYRSPYIHTPIEKATIESNLVITYRKLNLFEMAIMKGCESLTQMPTTTEFTALRKKILFNVLKSMQTRVQNLSEHQEKESELNEIKQKARILLAVHPGLLDNQSNSELATFFDANLATSPRVAQDGPATGLATNPSSFLHQASGVKAGIQLSGTIPPTPVLIDKEERCYSS